MGLVAFLVVCGLSYSDDSFGLEDILERAKVANPSVNAQKMNVESKRELKEKAWKNLILPPVDFSNEEEWEIIKDDGAGFKDVEIYLPIFEGGKNLNAYRKAKTQLGIAEKDSLLSEITAQEMAVSEYFSVLNARKQIEITNKAIEALEKQRERVNDLYVNGKIVPKSEVLKIEADIENNKAINLENIHDESTSLGKLAKSLGYPIDSNLELRDFDPTQYLAGKTHLEEENRKDIKNTILGEKEQLKLDSASYDINIAKADLYPKFYTRYTYTFKEKVNGKLKTVNEDTFEIGFRWVLAWGANLDNVRASEYAYEKAKIEYEDNLQGISLDMKNKLSEIKTLYGKALAMGKRVDLLRENMEIDSMRYENELLSTFDYLNSVNSFREAQEDYYTLQRGLVLAVIEYENLYK